MTKAIVYARVSTDDQADKGFSLAAQVEAGRKYAEAHAMTVSQELIDDGVSGAMAFSERPAGATAWALLRSGKAQALIVQNVDRLSRDVVDLLVTIRALLRAGVEVHCLDLGRVTSEYDIMLVIRGWQGSDERQKINRRTMSGKREKLAQGMVIGGTLPYGYTHLRDAQGRIVNFVEQKEQAAVVRLIFQWYTVGDNDCEPLSVYEITTHLRENGIPTKFGGGWQMSTVSRILHNPVYKGEWHYNAKANGDAPQRTFVVSVPALVSAEVWDVAQAQLERNKLKATRNAKRDYLLRGIIKCGCGYAMAGVAKKNKGGVYRYYRCGSRVVFKDEKQCQLAIRADHIEAATWAALRDRIKNSDTYEADLREAQRLEDEEREPKTIELEAVLAMMAEGEAEAVKLAKTLEALTEKQRKGIVGRTLQDKVDALDERYNDLAARRDKLEAELANRHFTDELIQYQLDFAADLRDGIENATNADKRFMLDTFDARVTVTDGKPKLSLQMPKEVLIDLHLP